MPASLRLLKYVLRRELPAQLPAIFRETLTSLPEPELSERVETMVRYVLEAERLTETEVAAALTAANEPGGSMETFFDRARTLGRQEGRQAGVAKIILRQLSRRFGALDEATRARIRTLSAAQLERLAESLLDFHTPADLAAWLRRVRVRQATKK